MSSAEGGEAAPDAPFAFLVGAIHSAGAPLIASMTMTMLITLAAYQVAGALIFLAPLVAHVVIGSAGWSGSRSTGLTSARG